QNAASAARSDFNMREVHVFVKGPGPGRESSVRSVQAAGLTVLSITDITPLPHNGCRPPKRRRV
ncbi:MAG: 30S ribosomal protein S11, partial [Caldilineaceae bacterium]|nr:30S ribosomal protein S11 [Caldilineaceae bacterium]